VGRSRLLRDLPGSHEYLLVGKDWANLRTGRVDTWQPIRVGPLASEARPRLAQSAPADALSSALVVSKTLHLSPEILVESA